MAIPLGPAAMPTAMGAAAPPLTAGPRGGDAPAPSPPPLPCPTPSRTTAPLSPSASRASEVPEASGIFRTRCPPYLRRSRDFLSAFRARRRMSISSE